MPLRGKARLKASKEIADFDYFGWWKALTKSGVQPSEAWNMDFIESTYMLDIEPTYSDISLALYHQRKQNGAPEECPQKD